MLLYIKSPDHTHIRSRDHLTTHMPKSRDHLALPTLTHMEERTVVCKRLRASFVLIEILQERQNDRGYITT